MSTATAGLACPPRFGTQRDYSRQTLGPAVGRVARMLGKPLMPWQQYVADVSLEIDNLTGHLTYDEILLTVPRQSGKTIFELAKATHRCSASDFFGHRQHVVYTAQTRKDARLKFVEEFAPALDDSPQFKHRHTPHWNNGSEHFRFQNGSWFGIESTTEKAGHGGSLDEAFIDEAFAQVDNRLEDAFSPAMITRRNSQLWVVSTAGWLDGSPFLLGKVEVARAHIESGAPGKLAVFEWSAHPDDDPEDEAVWWRCMPALGHTVPIDAIRSELEKAKRKGDLNGFRRAYLNQWVLKDAAEDTVIDLEAWAKMANQEDRRPSPVALSIEASDDRKWWTISLAGLRSDGRRHVQIVDTFKGSSGVARRVAELKASHKPVSVALRSTGPAGSLLGELATLRVDVVKVAGQELGQACGLFVDTVENDALRHSGQPQIAVAIGAAVKRHTGSVWTWKSNGSTDVSPLWAVTVALHALDRPKKQHSGIVV